LAPNLKGVVKVKAFERLLRVLLAQVGDLRRHWVYLIEEEVNEVEERQAIVECL
jgi:regulator of replication initiation timing